MTVDERIIELNQELDPFYLVDLENGKFSLCAIINDMDDEFGQAAFDAFALEIGASTRDEFGCISFGDGYDWEAAFQEAFKDDPNISRIHYDCESSGFFCDCDDLEILADFGQRLKELSLDAEKFTPIVLAAMKAQAEQRRLLETVRGQLMAHPKATFDIVSPLGEIRITPDMSKMLLAGELATVQISGVQYADYELLDQPIKGQQTDLFDDNLIRMKTEEAPEPEEAPAMMM